MKPIETEMDIFSNKSSLILFWLIANHSRAEKEGFSVNELSRMTGVSIGLVHRIIKQISYDGIIVAKGFRTSKKFYFRAPTQLLLSWIRNYNLLKKTRYKGFSFPQRFNEKRSDLHNLGLFPALHTSSSEIFRIKTTNIRIKEYYLLDWKKLSTVTQTLHLNELDRGYEILLIKPFYSALLLKLSKVNPKHPWMQYYALMTFLDLFHFPLRGIEQAEMLFRKIDFLKSICSWSEIENANR